MLQLKSISIPYIAVATLNVWQQEFALHKGALVHINAASGKEKSSLIQIIYNLNSEFNGGILFHGKSNRNKSFVGLASNCIRNCTFRAYFCSVKKESSTSNSFCNLIWQR